MFALASLLAASFTLSNNSEGANFSILSIALCNTFLLCLKVKSWLDLGFNICWTTLSNCSSSISLDFCSASNDVAVSVWPPIFCNSPFISANSFTYCTPKSASTLSASNKDWSSFFLCSSGIDSVCCSSVNFNFCTPSKTDTASSKLSRASAACSAVMSPFSTCLNSCDCKNFCAAGIWTIGSWSSSIWKSSAVKISTKPSYLDSLITLSMFAFSLLFLSCPNPAGIPANGPPTAPPIINVSANS